VSSHRNAPKKGQNLMIARSRSAAAHTRAARGALEVNFTRSLILS